MTWYKMIRSFKRKQHYNRRLNKYKTILCPILGDLCPVVSWIAVILLSILLLSKIHKMHTNNIVFTLDYPQTEDKIPIYFHTPKGIDFGKDCHQIVLMLKKIYMVLKMPREMMGMLITRIKDIRIQIY